MCEWEFDFICDAFFVYLTDGGGYGDDRTP